MDRYRIDTLATRLRLLSHPGLGATGMSDAEREDLRNAAATLEQLHDIGRDLAKAIIGLLEYGPVANGDAYAAVKRWVGSDDTRRNGMAGAAGMGAQEVGHG